jgi:hypothetical protein
MQWLPRQEIDVARWDAAIAQDSRPLPYGLHWWLDTVATAGWSGLVLDNYRAVMPLPHGTSRLQRFFPLAHRLFGGYDRWWTGNGVRVQRPPFAQQLGPFGEYTPTEVKTLLSFATQKTILNGFPVSARITEQLLPVGLPRRKRTNLVLDLGVPYETIFNGYGKTLKKHLRKSAPYHLTPAPAPLVVSTYQQQLKTKTGLRAQHFTIIKDLIQEATHQELGKCYQLKNDGGKLLAAGFFPIYQRRVINLFASSTPLGYEQRGMAKLLDAVIQEHQPTADFFDFEGSDIPGVREFFESFGPASAPYWQLG